MANHEQIEKLKQGVDDWNMWRQEHPEIQPDLSGANLSSADLSFVDLSFVDLSFADLSGTNLSRANLSRANLYFADLRGTNLHRANLDRANLSAVKVGWTIFGDVDLRTVKGLGMLTHVAPSTIGTDTLLRSEGDIPEAFLLGAGLSNASITYARSLIQNAIEYYTCFISYSSKDQKFAERLYADLQSNGVRCWFAPEDMKIGDRIRDRIDQSIRLYDKLLLVLSEQSVMSQWVEDEVETAMEKERLTRERGEERTVLFPVRLDEAVKVTTKAWAAKLRRQRYIGDFTRWKNHDEYQKAFNRLLRDLKA